MRLLLDNCVRLWALVELCSTQNSPGTCSVRRPSGSDPCHQHLGRGQRQRVRTERYLCEVLKQREHDRVAENRSTNLSTSELVYRAEKTPRKGIGLPNRFHDGSLSCTILGPHMSHELLTAVIGFLGAVIGGVLVALVNIVYKEWDRKRETRESASDFVDANLEPILNTADSLSGKLTALANGDFIDLVQDEPMVVGKLPRHLLNTTYLFARFWGELEVFREKSLRVAFQEDRRGRELSQFVSALEADDVRLVERGIQRAIGERLVDWVREPIQSLRFGEFTERYASDESLRAWLDPLTDLLRDIRRNRQAVLVYGTTLQAMIDHFDPERLSSQRREPYPNKLNADSRRLLNMSVFGVYCRGVKIREPKKYFSRKRSAPRRP